MEICHFSTKMQKNSLMVNLLFKALKKKSMCFSFLIAIYKEKDCILLLAD